MMLPAPEPMLSTSTRGMVSVRPVSRVHRSVSGVAPPRIAATSVLVPPTSMVSRFDEPHSLASLTLPLTPPTGPETSWKTGARPASAKVATPPFIIMIHSVPV
jgi:hypothetical protein